MGELFGDGTTPGYSGQLFQTTPETLDIGFAELLPPTSFTGTATTGGSLAANTYYGYLYASTSATCGSGAQSTFAYALGIAVSGSNNAINFTWAAPPASPLNASITGYCIAVYTGYIGPGNYIATGLYISRSEHYQFSLYGAIAAGFRTRLSDRVVSSAAPIHIEFPRREHNKPTI